MKHRVIFTITFVSLLLILNSSFSAVKNIRVGHGLTAKASPEETIFDIMISTDKDNVSLNSSSIIDLKIENISGFEQEINFWNITVRAKRGVKVIPPSFFFKSNFNGKIILPKGTFMSLRLPLGNVYVFDKPGEYILRVDYELPNSNKVIGSNDLKITIEP